LKEHSAALLKSEGQKCGKTVFSFRVMLNNISGTLIKYTFMVCLVGEKKGGEKEKYGFQ
jgi:hypothetical protein